MTGTAVGSRVGVGTRVGDSVALAMGVAGRVETAVSSIFAVSVLTVAVSPTSEERVGGGGKMGVGSATGSPVQAANIMIIKSGTRVITALYNGVG